MTREEGSYLVVTLDCLIMLIIAISIIRLRWYEKVSVADMKKGKLRVEDFSVYIPNIPVSGDDYSNSTELLKAMIATHFEDIMANELQQIPELEEFQENQTCVSAIHFGTSSHVTMTHLVEMWKHCEKIADLKKKIQVDPSSTRVYEADIWKHYTRVTELNDHYYAEKNNIT